MRDVARQQGHMISESENSAGPAPGMGEPLLYLLFLFKDNHLPRFKAVPITTAQLEYRKKVEQNVINGIKLHEAWDMLDAMKTLIMNDKRGTLDLARYCF